MSDLSLLPVGREYDHDKLRAQIERLQYGTLWGQRSRFTPRLLDKVWGDGRRLFAISPIMHRPRYIVARVDSSIGTLVDMINRGGAADGNGDDCMIDEIYESVVDQFGWCHCKRCQPDEDDPDSKCAGFPYNVDWSDGSSWGGYYWPDLLAERDARNKYKRRHLLPWRASSRIGHALAEALTMAGAW